MKEKQADKDIKDFIHLYLGCSVETDLGRGTLEIISTGDMGCAGSYGVQQEHDSEVYHETDLDWIKLILRPLSDMTEEEAIELVKLRSWKQYGPHPQTREYTTYKNSFNQIVVSWGDGLREKNVPVTKEVFDPLEFQYLLSQGFDLFNLIPEGLAIDKTKQLQP